MTILRVHDTEGVALSCDLRDFLDLLAPRSIKATWIVSPVDAGCQWFDATGSGGELLNAMAQSGEPVSGATLMDAARDTVQLVWGTFTARSPAGHGRQWVVIRAIDGHFYEVMTGDPKVISRIQSRFDKVSVHDETWKPAPRDPNLVPFYGFEP